MSKLKNLGKKIVAGSAVALASVSAFAVDHSAAINAAGADGETNVTAAALVVIAISSIVVGITLVLSLMKR